MVCTSCEKRIDSKLKKLKGVLESKSNYKKSVTHIKYDETKCSYQNINLEIKKIGYSISKKDIDEKNNKSELISIIGIVALALIIIKLGQNSGSFNMSEALDSKVSFVALFVIGLLTSLHCVGMCGGIMMSQSIEISNGPIKNKLKPAILYNLGRLISYIILGGIVGGIGKVFSVSTGFQSGITIFAGVFMVIMGFNMSGYKTFRKFYIKLPWTNCKNGNKSNRPFIVGLLNGFMPCGPLQTMQLYALASGSVLLGALSMFFFAIGTVPLMIIFGVVANLLSQKNSVKLMKFSGIIIIVLGVTMASRGISLMGIDLSSISNIVSTSSTEGEPEVPFGSKAVITDGKQTIEITAGARGYSPKVVYIQKDIPTDFIINGERLTSCNNEINIPSLNIKKKLKSGENVISFTPGDSDINYSCWMGMLRGNIKVVDDLSKITNNDSISSKSKSILNITSSAPKISDLTIIDELRKIKESLRINNKYMSYNEVVDLLGEGTISYPSIDDNSLMVMYWEFEENGFKYFLDASFYQDKFINMESRLVEFPDRFEKENIINYSEVKDSISEVKSLSELESIIGQGVKVTRYYTEGDDIIYGWSHAGGFTTAYTTNGDDILYIKTAERLDQLVKSSNSCH